MGRRGLVLIAVLAFLVGGGAVAAFALTSPGGHDPGPYVACVSSQTGTVRMVEVPTDSPDPECHRLREYSIQWDNGEAIRGYSNTNFDNEIVGGDGVTSWFRQLACPEGTEPLGGGGAFLPDPGEEGMALQSSVPTTDEDLGGGLHGWEVGFVSVDGQYHTGEFQVFVTCAPATED